MNLLKIYDHIRSSLGVPSDDSSRVDSQAYLNARAIFCKISVEDLGIKSYEVAEVVARSEESVSWSIRQLRAMRMDKDYISKLTIIEYDRLRNEILTNLENYEN